MEGFAPVGAPVVPVNILVRDRRTGEVRPVGKRVQYRGRWIVHAHAQDGAVLLKTMALPVGWPMLHALLEAGGEDVFLYLADQHATYHVDLATVREHGLIGKPDDCGHKFNVPVDRWERAPIKLPLPFLPFDPANPAAGGRLYPTDAPPWGVPPVRPPEPRRELPAPEPQEALL